MCRMQCLCAAATALAHGKIWVVQLNHQIKMSLGQCHSPNIQHYHSTIIIMFRLSRAACVCEQNGFIACEWRAAQMVHIQRRQPEHVQMCVLCGHEMWLFETMKFDNMYE